MSFFDSKEEVLSVELTPYGKHLLSKGLFKPAFYTFHDDNVLYDIEYTGHDEELQTSSSQRIMDQTPYLNLSGRTTSVDKTITHVEPTNYKSDSAAMANLLGNSSFTSNYKPAWDIKIMNGEAERYETQFTGSNITLNIPQIFLKNINYETKALEDDSGDIVFQDNTSIKIENNYLLLDISEMNVDFKDDRFEIELYEIKEEANGAQLLEQVPFRREQQVVINNILLDEDQIKEINVDPQTILAENYFNLLVDNEIDLEVMPKEVDTRIVKKVKPPFGEVC